jgi:hypothetical protein
VYPKFKEKGHRIRVIETGAKLFHYWNVKSKKALEAKHKAVQSYWGDKSFGEREFDYYQYFPRQFVTEYSGTHPMVMSKRISSHPVSLDLSTSSWRSKLTWRERRRLLKTMFVTKITDRFSGRGSYRLLKR